jgi:hypothetical protein
LPRCAEGRRTAVHPAAALDAGLGQLDHRLVGGPDSRPEDELDEIGPAQRTTLESGEYQRLPVLGPAGERGGNLFGNRARQPDGARLVGLDRPPLQPTDLHRGLHHLRGAAKQIQPTDPQRHQLAGTQPGVGGKQDQWPIPPLGRRREPLDLLGVQEVHLLALDLRRLDARSRVAGQPATLHGRAEHLREDLKRLAGPLGRQATRRNIQAGETFIVWDDDTPAATITINRFAKPELWTPEEAAEPALYAHKVTVDRAHAGQGLGAELQLSRSGLVLPPRPGWRDLAGRCWHARPQPQAPHQPTRHPSRPLAGEVIDGRLRWLCRLPLAAWWHATVYTVPQVQGQADRPARQQQRGNPWKCCGSRQPCAAANPAPGHGLVRR